MELGTDVVAIARITKVRQRFGSRFIERLLSVEELNQKNWDDAALARRWALKEAVAKALGCGIGNRLSFKDIVVSYSGGAPYVSIKGQEHLKIKVSVSDDLEAGIALAVCVVY